LRRLPDHVEIYCRERLSHAFVSEYVTDPDRVALDLDLAFQIDYSRWRGSGRGVLNAFRTDKEAPRWRIPKDNHDLSWGPDDEGAVLLAGLAPYDLVHTNRAHIGIASAMMGKEVHLYPSIYHKQLGIYEYSLRHFPNVHWHSDLPGALHQ
jgi:exopolysaccharide biosynthesis predicted pyruvyltransferase EpsI